MLQGYIQSIQELSKTLAQGADLNNSIEVLCKQMTNLFHLNRASVWVYKPESKSMHCLKLYEKTGNLFSSGKVLSEEEAPLYFNELKQGRIIDVSDVSVDERISEFRSSYLLPLSIASMLATPFFQQGRLGGIICLESFERREWSMEEKLLSRSLGDLYMIALVQEQLHNALDTIESQREEIFEINQSLEKRVIERTSALERQNDMLIEYSFINSHLLRGPICTLKGLVSLMRMEEMKEDRDVIINKMEEPIDQLDGLSGKLKKVLNQGVYVDPGKLA